MAKKTKAQEFMDEVTDLIKKYNIPCMAVVADPDVQRTGVIIDNREEMIPINKAVLMDAMVNASKQFMNIVFDAVATVIALSPTSFHNEFESHIRKLKEIDIQQKKGKNIIKNTAEA